MFYINIHFLFIGSLKYEGFGLILIEAMQLDKPVICANCTSYTELIEDYRFMFNHDNDSFYKLIEKITLDSKLYNDCKNNSINKKDNYKWEKIIDRFALYLKI